MIMRSAAFDIESLPDMELIVVADVLESARLSC